MIFDQQGNALHGANAEAARHFDLAIHSFNSYRGDLPGHLSRAIEAAPAFGMAHVFEAWVGMVSTEPAAIAAARSTIRHLESMPRDARVDAHLAALRLLGSGQWSAAARSLERYSSEHPHDMLALQAGHLLDFCRADSRTLRDRIARALPHWPADMPGHAFLLGMHAFGLEECGDYSRAEDSGRRALAMQPLDAWGHHAVAHVMEMQGRPEDGLGWMIAREPHWGGEDNFFKVHNWWHRALFHLDLGQTDEVLALYDGPVREAHSAVAYDLIDASALLWRLELLGISTGNRWEEVAHAWEAIADGRTYAFNDWHAVMAWLGAGRDAEVEQMIAAWRNLAGERDENARWIRQVGLPLVEGFTAFWRGDHATAVERLHATRHFTNVFGGSHAQRDIISFTLVEAALRAGQGHFAQALVQERLAMKPHSALNRAMLARAMQVASTGAGRKAA